MPFLSRAQQRWAHTSKGTKALGGPAAVHEWDQATDFSHLPEHVMKTERVNLGKKGSFDVKKGALHEMLHIPDDQTIPESRIKSAEHSSTPLLRRRARSAEGFKHMKHGR